MDCSPAHHEKTTEFAPASLPVLLRRPTISKIYPLLDVLAPLLVSQPTTACHSPTRSLDQVEAVGWLRMTLPDWGQLATTRRQAEQVAMSMLPRCAYCNISQCERYNNISTTHEACRLLEGPAFAGDWREGTKIGPRPDCNGGGRGGVPGSFGVTGGVIVAFGSECLPRVAPLGGVPNGVVILGEGDGNDRVGKAIGLIAGAGVVFQNEPVVRTDSVGKMSGRSKVSTCAGHDILRFSR